MNPYCLFNQYKCHHKILYLYNFFGHHFIVPEDRQLDKNEIDDFIEVITFTEKPVEKQGNIKTWFLIKLCTENSPLSN